MSATRKACIFCDGPVGGVAHAPEHIYPKWLQEHLGIRRDGVNIFGRLLPAAGEPAVPEAPSYRKPAFSSFVAGGVCKGCNEGWMSTMEGETKSLLIPLIDGIRPVASLSPEEAAAVALWAAKTAYSLNSASVAVWEIPSDHPPLLKPPQGSLAPGVAVFAEQSAVSDEAFRISADWWMVFDPREPTLVGRFEALRPGSYKISFQASRLHLMVAYFPGGLHAFCVEPATLRVLAPGGLSVAAKPPGAPPAITLPEHAELGVHNHFHTSVGLWFARTPPH